MWTLKWQVRCPRPLNALSHTWRFYGFSPVCTLRWWALTAPRRENSLLQTVHSNAFSPVSPVRLSVCRLSVVGNARAPYSRSCNFRQSFYGVWYIGHPLTCRPTENFMEIVLWSFCCDVTAILACILRWPFLVSDLQSNFFLFLILIQVLVCGPRSVIISLFSNMNSCEPVT